MRLVGDAKSSLGDAKSSLGAAKSSLGYANISLGARLGAIVDAIQERYVVTAAQLFTLERQNAQEFFEVYKGVVAPAEYSGMVEHLTSGLFLGASSPPSSSRCLGPIPG